VAACDTWTANRNLGVYVHAKVQTYDDALMVCGSANMNRRSLECDAELDCAVLHRGTVRAHMAGLYACVTSLPWTDFGDGWLSRYWAAIKANSSRALIPDPFFVQNVGSPKTPNGVPMPYDGIKPYTLFEPSSIGSAADSAQCAFPECPGDPKAPGRLDEVTYLIERCHRGNSWPWRIAATSAAADLSEAELAVLEGAEAVSPADTVIPRLTL
jgi:hypothetical protein